MLHATDVTDLLQSKPPQQIRKAKSSSCEHKRLSRTLADFQDLYVASELCRTIVRQLRAISRSRAAPITTIVSLGLGSLSVVKCESRRMKQLVILLSVRDILHRICGSPIEVYAQDPSFTRLDESFLLSLDIKILHTSSADSLGEAASTLSPATLVYSPFLTLEVYEQLLNTSKMQVPLIFGDDFTALLKKWPKRSPEQKQVEALMKTGLASYKRSVVGNKGFWDDEDGSFPMAIYDVTERQDKAKQLRAKI
ncbi:hypothetical protein HBH61_244500 [Parastagonospora nodorum]|nr:hypothetical protein HBH61_244500 [Parastagonospora nodorum]KAH4982351.1 hypothetical protein HBI76_159970 [Parastagonospora nodorum]